MTDKRAVFLDRDGTINVEKDYLIDPKEFEFIAGVPQALKRLQDAGFLLVIVTNQSGVARGYFDLDDVHRLHDHMCQLLRDYGVTINRIEICPHHPNQGAGEFRRECDCRKGRPGMLLRAATDLQIDLKRSFMVGDKLADVDAGLAAGCRTFMVLTGYGAVQQRNVSDRSVTVLSALTDVVEDILAAQGE